MARFRLIHWNAKEAEERAASLRAADLDVAVCAASGPAIIRELRASPPEAVIISLERLPSHGREIALAIRSYKATRYVPIVFTDGEPEKVARIRDLLPDAIYTTWNGVRRALKQAAKATPVNPVKPASVLAAYAGTPVIKKLGVKPKMRVAVSAPPPEFDNILGDLPEDVTIRDRADARCDLILWFVRSRAELERELEWMVALLARGPLWILWPKKSTGINTGLTQLLIREIANTVGLVDYKICAIDATWSGLLFRPRK